MISVATYPSFPPGGRYRGEGYATRAEAFALHAGVMAHYWGWSAADGDHGSPQMLLGCDNVTDTNRPSATQWKCRQGPLSLFQ